MGGVGGGRERVRTGRTRGERRARKLEQPCPAIPFSTAPLPLLPFAHAHLQGMPAPRRARGEPQRPPRRPCMPQRGPPRKASCPRPEGAGARGPWPTGTSEALATERGDEGIGGVVESSWYAQRCGGRRYTPIAESGTHEKRAEQEQPPGGRSLARSLTTRAACRTASSLPDLSRPATSARIPPEPLLGKRRKKKGAR